MAYTTIDDPSAHFQVTIYTGNGGSQDITNGGNSDLQPDLLWIKQRSSGGNVSSHVVKDSTRGVSAELYPNAASAEGSSSLIDAFLTDGFSIDNTANEHYNYDDGLYVSYQWKANGGSEVSVGASGSGITDILASSHQANTTAGFSIVKWTSVSSEAYVSHGLGAVPHCYIVKDRENGSANWMMYHKQIGGSGSGYNGMIFNTSAAIDQSSFWRDADAAATGDPTSSIFKLGTQGYTGGHNNDMIAYCWAPIQGYSKFGKYTGNGNADGPFVYTGFKPALVIWKITSSTGDWDIYDTGRDTYNLAFKELLVNETNDESDATTLSMDILSNGFKVRTSNANGNADGENYIFLAFAEQPFVTSEGVPCTAR